ncbi:hypothetical protein D9613_007612 [Agrocybe pediades]|uniref:GST N-terminal domain-containing protein n=1 Tax=Agrocybe pediades TaxID=84607 RepID=A0A8H4QP43_9AGAR|nr:hypothetical protein D9613_007612 [Agrocybe pediades]
MKTRYALNYKGLVFKTEWVALPDIEAHCKKLGIKPTGKAAWAPESDYYTLPAIHDPSTGTYISDSLLIAKYLDETYPDTPRIFPNKAEVGLQLAFVDAFVACVAPAPALAFTVAMTRIDRRSEEYIRRTREKAFGATIEEMTPTGEKAQQEWEKLRKGLDKVAAWYAETDDKGPYILGDVVSWADFVVGGQIMMLKALWGENSEEWKRITAFNDGRWGALIESLAKYAS